MSNLALILLIVLVLMLLGTLPIWPHAIAWGYTPGGIVLVLLLVVVVLMVTGKLK